MEITLLYASLLIIFAVLLALKTGMTRGSTKTMLGNGESPELLQAVRAHGNLTENAPFAIILLGLLEMQSVADWKLHLLGSLFFLFRILHAYGISISRESTPYRLVGTLGTWLILMVMSVYGIFSYLVSI
ncbi:MAG: hypothetical protein CMD68_02815 [Gammaproteobacteria bacterium]|nr:hypothetical protein [Gammaproteobacteria bacterium]|tara:strand:+ start:752 stop:1141 length:390 start_codon:yes stop_codon:yes gene_type:complete